MDFLEKDLEDLIYQTPIDNLKERGYRRESLLTHVIRQPNLGHYGKPDLVEFGWHWFSDPGMHRAFIRIVELKKGAIGLKACVQGARYRVGLMHWIREMKPFIEDDSSIEVLMIGRELDLSDNVFLMAELEHFEFMTYSYDIDGLRFKKVYPGNYINTSFNPKR